MSSLSPCYIFHIDGNHAKLDNIANVGVIQNEMYSGPCTYGKFGKTAPDVQARSGKEFYEIELSFMDGTFKSYAVMGQDNTTLIMMGFYRECETYNWISEEDMIKFRESCDHVSSPATPYELKPGKPGKLVWVTGTPGAGKTTSAFFLGKKHGFVYFEADCYFLHINPYVPLSVESPAGAFFKQPPLKVFSTIPFSFFCLIQIFLQGIDRKRIDACQRGEQFYNDLPIKGVTEEVHADGLEMYKEMSQYIKDERQRIGGDWAVAQAVPTKALRDEIKKILPDVTFVTLTIKEEDLKKRLQNRHGEDQSDINDIMLTLHKFYEPAEEDEANAFNIDLENSMTPDDVVEIIMKKL